MANNELSGPVVAAALARWLGTQASRRFTYRIVFVPETIGAIAYLSLNAGTMKARTAAGFVITCVGDERAYSFLPSRLGETLADRVAQYTLGCHAGDYITYSFLDRGSDERQYCSPGIDLPVVSIMRTKYGCYPEYHTSLDDFSVVTPTGLQGGFDAIAKALWLLEVNYNFRMVTPCEPQLGKRGLWPSLSMKGSTDSVRDMLNLIAYSDGQRDLVGLCAAAKVDAFVIAPILAKLLEAHVIAVDGA